MNRIQVGLRALGIYLASACMAPAWAQFTWQTTHTTNGGFNSGTAELLRTDLFVTVHPGYADVEEEVEIAATGMVSAGNDANTLEINGDFTLPIEATVVGLLLWDGDKILEAKLLSKAKADSLYQVQVDRNSIPPARPRDPILLSLASPGEYHFSIYPVKANATRRFRLRYHLPPKIGVEGLKIPFLPAFAPWMGAGKVQIHLSGADNVDTITWIQQGLPKRIGLPRNLFVSSEELITRPEWIEYQCCDSYGTFREILHPTTTGIEIRPKDPLYQALFTTTLPAGQMQGNYMHLYSQIPDSALTLAGMRVEIAVYWKWHNPHVWVESNFNGYSDYNAIWQAESQANQLQDLFDLVQPQGAAIGLIHNDGRNPARTFPMAAKNQIAFTQARDYLAQWNSPSIQAFATKAAYDFKEKPSTAKQRSEASANAFQSDIRLVASLFSKTEKVVRHVILLSAGTSGDLQDSKDLNAILKEAFKDISPSIGQAMGQSFQYPGFDMYAAKAAFPLPERRLFNYVAELPTLPNFTTTAVLRNGANAYDLDLKCMGGLGLTCDAALWHGKSTTPWSKDIEWEVHDVNGVAAKTYVQTLSPTTRDNDTALAVLWAGSASPFSENREPPLGAVYGFVDRSASLLALEKDSLKISDGKILPNGSVPRIANADILDVIPNYKGESGPNNPNPDWTTDVLSKTLANPQGWQVRLGAANRLELHLPGLHGWQGLVTLQIVGLDGRMRWSGKVHVDAQGWASASIPTLPSGMHWLRISAQGQLGTKAWMAP